MRAVIQRVLNASVTVDGTVVGQIEKGLMVLVGISVDDEKEDMEYIVRKVINMRLFADDTGKTWTKSVKDIQGGVLFVSQFTLQASLKGHKPDLRNAMGPAPAKDLYTKLLKFAKSSYHPSKIQDGQFGAMMQVALINDGPVTILLDSIDRAGRVTPASGTATPVSAASTPVPESESSAADPAPSTAATTDA